ncbi:MAG: aspartate-semialdehyde dehydrogenase [Anaerovoracaceae bacterium]
MLKKPDIAIVGATGVVGTQFLRILEERLFPFEKAYLMSSAKSAGKRVNFCNRDYLVEELNEQSFDKDIDIALFSAGGAVSEKYAAIAANKGVKVIDNSSAWRMNPHVPLVVPEVNPEDVRWNKGIIANPNCSTIQAVVLLKPLMDAYGLKRVIYSTYQAVSGSGVKGISDLENGMTGKDTNNAYKYPIAGNCIPQIDTFLENGYTKEEVKMIEETKKILHNKDIGVTATTVRVPVFNAHSESINIEFEKEFDLKELVELLAKSKGIVVQDDTSENVYPLARDVSGSDMVYVGRIRRDYSVKNGINLWCVADNIRKGAATNAIQIAELLLK